MSRDISPSTRDDWQTYPYNQASHLPFRDPYAEFGIQTILNDRFPDEETSCRILDGNENGSTPPRDFSSNSDSFENLLQAAQPAIRVFIFQRRHDCPTKSWPLSAQNLKRLFSHYRVQPCFVHRLKSYRYSASSELYRAHNAVPGEAEMRFESHDLQMNFNIPFTNHTIFGTCYFTYDATSKKQALLLFNDTSDAKHSEQFAKRLEDLLTASFESRLYHESLLVDPFTLPALLCGLVAEGWDRCSYNLELKLADMEKNIQNKPDDKSWDSEAMFGVKPGLMAFQETVALLKKSNTAFAETATNRVAIATVEDLFNQQDGLLRSVKRDFDYRRGRLEDVTRQSFNSIAMKNSKATADIAEQNFRDATSVRTIALVTLFFLPGTFIATFFSMPFFSASGAAIFSELKATWIYFAIALPLTASTVGVWEIWRRNLERQRKAKAKEGHHYELSVHGNGMRSTSRQLKREESPTRALSGLDLSSQSPRHASSLAESSDDTLNGPATRWRFLWQRQPVFDEEKANY